MTESTMDLAPDLAAPAPSAPKSAAATDGGGPRLALTTKLSYGFGSVAAGVSRPNPAASCAGPPPARSS